MIQFAVPQFVIMCTIVDIDPLFGLKKGCCFRKSIKEKKETLKLQVMQDFFISEHYSTLYNT